MKLKKCPFCGGEAEMKKSKGDRDGPGITTIECPICHAISGKPVKQRFRCGTYGYSDRDPRNQTHADAIEKYDTELAALWNIRASD